MFAPLLSNVQPYSPLRNDASPTGRDGRAARLAGARGSRDDVVPPPRAGSRRLRVRLRTTHRAVQRGPAAQGFVSKGALDSGRAADPPGDPQALGRGSGPALAPGAPTRGADHD